MVAEFDRPMCAPLQLLPVSHLSFHSISLSREFLL
jgi:hypothetical protein